MANHEQDLLWVANPTFKDFTVIWGKRPYTVEARKKKVYPRFIAEHFAKHLADKILLEREAAEKEKTSKQVNYLNSKQHRPPVVQEILPGVYQYFIQDNSDPEAAVQRQIEDANANISEEDKALDLGDIDTDKALGNLEDFEEEDLPPVAPPVPTAPTIPTEPATIDQQPPVGHTLEEAVTTPTTTAPNAINGGQASPDASVITPTTAPTEPPTQPTEPTTPGGQRSINELRSEAKRLGLKTTGRESKDMLLSMIQNF